MNSGGVIHQQTEQLLAAFLQSPSHALLLTGPDGVGKSFLADYMAASLLQLKDSEALTHYPYIWRSPGDESSISIDTIRELQKFLQLKTAGKKSFRRAAIIEHADSMSLEAQNALLKILEEPPADSILILTSAQPRVLLPTIHSRLQSIAVHPPEQQTILEFFKKAAASSEQLKSVYFLSGGLPGLMHALLRDDTAHPLRSSVELAKTVLQQTQFERLAQVDVIAKQKNGGQQLLTALERIAQISLEQAAVKSDNRAVRRWHHILKTVFEAQKALEVNTNTKLTLTHLLLNL